MHTRNAHQLGAALLGFALFALVAGVAALVAPHDVAVANAVRGTGLLVGSLLVVGVSMWLNRKRTR